MTLADLKAGENARITQVDAPNLIRHRLNDIGFREGVEVSVIRQAPLTDPIEFKVRGSYISLRRKEASLVKVALIE